MKTVLFVALLITPTVRCFSQSESTVLILTNKAATVIFDGEAKGVCLPNVPFKIVTVEGDHYAQVQVKENGIIRDKGDIIVTESGKQKILKLLFEEITLPIETALVKVADLNFAIPGVVTVSAWKNNNPGQDYQYPAHYIAFEKGDIIVINTSMTNKNGTNILEVSTYPDNVLKYTNNKFTELSNLEIRVEERAIYRFAFATNHAFDRNCFLSIQRKPASPETASFNPKLFTREFIVPFRLWSRRHIV